jgi:hypothetical protein
MSTMTWRGAATGLVAGLLIVGFAEEADAQRGGRGAGAGAARAGAAGLNHGGAAAGGGFSHGGVPARGSGGMAERGGGAQQLPAGSSRADMQQGRQDSQAQRQQAVHDNQAQRQTAIDNSNGGCINNNCSNWDGRVAAGVVAGAVVAGAVASANAAATAPVLAPPCNVAATPVSGVPYYRCGATWYTAGYAGDGVVYMPVPAPAGY